MNRGRNGGCGNNGHGGRNFGQFGGNNGFRNGNAGRGVFPGRGEQYQGRGGRGNVGMNQHNHNNAAFHFEQQNHGTNHDQRLGNKAGV